MPITEKQRRFIEAYSLDPDIETAAIAAGYSPKSARRQGARLLRSGIISERIVAVESDLSRFSSERKGAARKKSERRASKADRTPKPKPSSVIAGEAESRPQKNLDDILMEIAAVIEEARAAGRFNDALRGLEIQAKYLGLVSETGEIGDDSNRPSLTLILTHDRSNDDDKDQCP